MDVNLKTLSWIKSFLLNQKKFIIVKQSEAVPVLPGVPQGSVLGPCLFIAYINDLPDSLKSRTRLFADDTIVHLTIDYNSDPDILQNDLYKFKQWEANWSMEFNPDKCEVIHVPKKKNPIIFPYKLHNFELRTVENDKYLGVAISHHFNWKTLIDNISSKANNTLKFIKRNIQTNNQKLRETVYNTYVHTQLEYCTTV